jgi:hypothetical protein
VPHITTAPEENPLPVTNKVNDGVPAAARLGDNCVNTGTEPEIEKLSEFVALLSGLVTETNAVPGAATRLDGMSAVKTDELPNPVLIVAVVEDDPPFHWTVAPFWKFVPLSWRGKEGEPAGIVEGLSALNVGNVAEVPIVKATLFEFTTGVPGFWTLTKATPVAAIKLAGTTAASCIELT